MSLIGGRAIEGEPHELLCGQALTTEYAVECAQALKEILSRPWWSRLWAAQEFALGSASVFMCGRQWFDSTQLIKDGTLNMIVPILSIRGVPAESLMLLKYFGSISLTQTTAIKRLWDLMPSQKPSGRAEIFCEILDQCTTKLCSDDRDRVFGLLGLSPESLALSIDATYDNSMTEVFESLTINLLRHLDSLLVLFTAGVGHPGDVEYRSGVRVRLEDPNLPSWVRDLRRPRLELMFPPWYGKYRTPFNAFASKEWTYRYANNQLMLKGLRIGNIPAVRLGTVCQSRFYSSEPGEQADGRRVLQSWMALCDVAGRERGRDPYPHGGFKADAFCRTLYGDFKTTIIMSGRGDFNSVRLQASDVDAIVQSADWAEKLAQYSDEEGEQEAFSIPPFIVGRRLFVTDTGYFGNGGAWIEPNDQIFIIMGCHYPVILRPTNSSQSCTTYRLVEICYVHGIMDGELFDGVPFTGKSEDESTEAYLERTEQLGDHVIEPVCLC
ncbi:hypothetical protein EDD36DRAFT_418977 [Exophiala viscosa]|uniref:Heterokaryon incompatibility domain-containing protein n=1 Tax=Exophiala viscosa TaxID=2486360 RepID=A0AAN6ICW4_9EURO|nr:hypothetical protein EDD36DRAFT_418977 [Exophiala viscosa]